MTSACSLTGYQVRPAVQALPGKPRTLAIRTFDNDTQQDRAAVILTDAFHRVMFLRTAVEVVDEDHDPDAVFVGRLTTLTVSPSNVNSSPSDVGKGLPKDRVLVSEYAMTAVLDISLFDTRQKKVIWNRSTTATKNFQASALQLENDGATMNSIINESRVLIEFRQLANQMMEGVYNELVSAF